MRLCAFLILAIAATPVAAAAPYASSFNGYSVSVVVRNFAGKHSVDAARPLAERVCASVDKTADFQTNRKLDQDTVEYFFLCL